MRNTQYDMAYLHFAMDVAVNINLLMGEVKKARIVQESPFRIVGIPPIVLVQVQCVDGSNLSFEMFKDYTDNSYTFEIISVVVGDINFPNADDWVIR